ncbi:ImmA/IrrE family metallo-endopeptidase [Pseudomonas aeruginosa]|nr:ImmA/IrrE family metallo-endopeptidase [Pseudomonas aeruginosa]
MSSTALGARLEEQVFEFFKSEVENGNFLFLPQFCKVFRQKGYYSAKRQSNIIFDVSIEAWLPGAEKYSFLVLIECKNYSHSVPVDDLEEFFSKVEQVSGGKGILVSPAELQKGALNFAKSSGIGFVRYLSAADLKWVLYRSPSSLLYQSPLSQSWSIEQSLLQRKLGSHLYDIYAVSGGTFTNSWREVFSCLLGEDEYRAFELAGVIRSSSTEPVVEYVGKNAIKNISNRLLNSIGYTGGRVSLEAIAKKEQKESGLAIVEIREESSYLGGIDFSSNQIGVYGGLAGCDERGRFTLGHELGHFYLNHSRYMLREGCDDSDIDLEEPPKLIISDVQRLEWQANHFSSCLLLPEDSFLESFYAISDRIGLSDKGYGALYLDDQACNYESYSKVSGYLKGRFGVSRSAVRYRLIELGLLNDVRS